MSFKDLYTESNYVVPIGAKTSVSLNGIDLRSFGFELTQLPDLAMPSIRQRNVTIDGRSGSIPMGDLYQNWNFSIGQLVGLNLEDAMKKKDNLLKWIDIEQNNLTKFVIGDKEYLGLNFQINGAPLYYSDKTVSVTNGSAEITGVSTSFTNYVSPGATFEVFGDDNIYTVQSITDDDTLHTLENISRSNGSGLAYRIERKRYLVVNYNGSSSITPAFQTGILSEAAPGQDKNVAFNLSIGFYSVYPYWIGDIFEHTSSSLDSTTTGNIIKIKGLGNAPVSPKYVFEGTANSPEITSGDFAFHAKFDATQQARDNRNKTIIDPTTSISTPVYKSFRDGFGLQTQNAASTYTLKSKTLEEGSFVCRIDPSSLGSNFQEVFKWDKNGSSATNYVSLNVKNTEIVVNYAPNGSGTTLIQKTGLNGFTNSSYAEISCWWDFSGRVDKKDDVTYYSKLFLNGEIVATESDEPTSYSQFLSDVSISASTNGTDVVIGELALFNKALSDEKIRSLYYSTEAIVNNNKTLTYSSSVDTNDILIYDSMTGDAEFYKQSAGTKINVMSNVSGNAPVLLGDDIDESANLLIDQSSASISKLHVIYRPHFR